MGNDVYCCRCGNHLRNFNPRSRVGNDHVAAGEEAGHGISIHVPAWGTTTQWPKGRLICQFQSTFPRGERQLDSGRSRSHKRFQSTFPRGERHFHELNLDWLLEISIHVPAWGTTEAIVGDQSQWKISIHVPAWGTTDTDCFL